jgi:hypothetical protein
MSRRALVAAVVIALIAYVAWWGTETSAPESPSSSPRRAVAEPAPVARDVAAPRRRTEVGGVTTAAASTVPPSTDSEPRDGPPPTKRTLVVRTIDGDPIVGARVSARRPGRSVDREVGIADSAGRVDILVDSDNRIDVAAEGYVSRWIRLNDEVVVLKRPTQVEGTVVDAQGRPVVGAMVKNDRSVSLPTSSDEHGRFRLDVDPDAPDVWLVVSHDGFITWEGDRGPGDLDVVVTLSRPGAIEGRLVLPDGRSATHGEVNGAEVEDDGAFALGPLPAGEHVLRASAEQPGRRYAAESIVRLADGETLRGVRLILAENPRSFLVLRVVGPDGSPVVFAGVHSTTAVGASSVVGGQIVVPVDVPPGDSGRVELLGASVRGVDYGNLSIDLVTRETPSGAPVVVTLPRIAWLDVDVVAPDDRRADQLSVRLAQLAGPSAHVGSPPTSARPARYRVVVEGAYRVFVDAAGFAPVARDVTADELAAGKVVVRLSAGATVKVHLVAAPPARMSTPWIVLGADHPVAWRLVPSGGVRTDGRYAIEHVRAGRCEARFMTCGCVVEKTLTIDVPESGVLDLGDVVLAGTTTLKGRVVAPDGRPSGGAALEYFDAKRLLPEDGVRATSATDGTFEIDVPVGATGDLCVSKSDLGGVMVPIDGKGAFTEVRLQPECRLRLVFRAKSARSWTPSVALARHGGTGLWCAPLDGEQWTTEAGYVEVRRGLAPGKWVVHLHEETPPIEREVTLVAGETSELVVDEP